MIGGGVGPWEMVIIAFIVLVLFGAGKLPRVMGDLGKGMTEFRRGLTGRDKEKKDNDEN